MRLNLDRPLAVFDLETTGVNITKDRIVEIAIIRIDPDGTETSYCRRVNPGIPIPEEISAIIRITDNDVKNEPKFEEIAHEVVSFIGNSDLAGYNSNKFDIPVLAEELMRIGSDFDISQRRFIDVQNIFHRMEQRTLSAAYQFYCNKNLDNAHSALYDTKATLDVLLAQLERYESITNDISFLADFSKGSSFNLLDFAGRLTLNENNEAVYNFGKHKGKTVKEVMTIEPGYYGWMLDADFPLYTKQCLRKEMERIRSKRNEKNQDNTDFQSKLQALKDKFK
jgi:DNA polymerase-3 subunit epsilon